MPRRRAYAARNSRRVDGVRDEVADRGVEVSRPAAAIVLVRPVRGLPSLQPGLGQLAQGLGVLGAP
jgi:hypothetical protein